MTDQESKTHRLLELFKPVALVFLIVISGIVVWSYHNFEWPGIVVYLLLGFFAGSYSVASGNVAVIYDDFVPRNGYKQTSEEVKKADDFVRSTVNGTGKDRCGSDGRLRNSPRPRGLAILTGEQLPEGCESLKWRTVNIQIDKTTFADVTSGDRPNHFDTLQGYAAQGEYAKAMRFFVESLAGMLNYARMQLGVWSPTSELVVHKRLIDSTGESTFEN